MALVYLGLPQMKILKNKITFTRRPEAWRDKQELFVVKGGRSKDAVVAGLIEQTVFPRCFSVYASLKSEDVLDCIY